ncbi:MAG TPA: VWA domain-containing protein [Bryobacteraceae bacterium]|nr:VWA domain-containing protein [Bryobacteraceae bacterium]
MRLPLSLPLLGIFSLLIHGQPVVREKEFTLTAHAELVLLDVSVKDVKGGYISNLKKDNFQIHENGKLQTISHYSSEDTPITAGLVIDDSSSMRPKRAEVVNSALAFIDASNPHDEMFVTHFNDHVRRGLPPGTNFTDNVNLLRTALWNSPAEGMTSLYDGILDALHQLDSGKQEKKCLIVISDGGDNASTHGFNDVLEAVRSTRAILYMIGVFDTEDPDRNPGLLRRLAGISGGIAYLPKDLAELPEICRGIAKDIRNRYSIGYVPVRANGGSSLRSIKVSVTGVEPRKVLVHARTSYLLPELP